MTLEIPSPMVYRDESKEFDLLEPTRESMMTEQTQAGPVPGWGHSSGAIAMGATAQVASDEQVTDRLAILQTVNRYAWAYDERQLDALQDTFTPDAVWEGSVADAVAIEPFTSSAAIVGWLGGLMEVQTDQRRHIVLNAIVTEQTADTAHVLTYLLLTSADADGVRVVTTGYYSLDLVRYDTGEWRIRHFFAGFDAPF
jgi:ketosteroid isomerase-like protein